MTAQATAAPKPARKRPTAAERAAAAEAEAADLRRQLDAATVANAAPMPPSTLSLAAVTNGNGHPAAGRAPLPPVLKFTTSSGAADRGPRVAIFEVDGREYTMPAQPDPSIGLMATHLVADRSVSPLLAEARATDYVLAEMLGPDGHAALLGLRNATKEQIQQIIQIVTTHAMGALEDDPKAT